MAGSARAGIPAVGESGDGSGRLERRDGLQSAVTQLYLECLRLGLQVVGIVLVTWIGATQACEGSLDGLIRIVASRRGTRHAGRHGWAARFRSGLWSPLARGARRAHHAARRHRLAAAAADRRIARRILELPTGGR